MLGLVSVGLPGVQPNQRLFPMLSLFILNRGAAETGLQPLKKQVVSFRGLFHQNFIPQVLLNKGLERRMTIFQHDSIHLRGNADLDVASICNGVRRKRKYHCCCMKISCLLPYGMKTYGVDVTLIRFIIPQQRPFTSSEGQRSNWSLL